MNKQQRLAMKKSLSERDQKSVWHPFTQEKTADLPIVIKEGKGSYLFDEDGNKYFDLISSWWVNLHGHSHPKICNAIYEQAKKLEHVIFAGFTHEPAVHLCEKLQTILPTSLTKFFFSDNGCGVKKEDQFRIFDVFYTTTAEYGGAGMGLFIIKIS